MQKERGRKGFVSVPPPMSGMDKLRARANGDLDTSVGSLLPAIHPHVQKELTQFLENQGAHHFQSDKKEYGKFTDKLKIVRQRKEELFQQKVKRKLRVQMA
jgi:hypothetical protein